MGKSDAVRGQLETDGDERKRASLLCMTNGGHSHRQ